MAPDKDRMAAQLFLQALFPLLKVVLEDKPEYQKKIRGRECQNSVCGTG